MHTFDLVVIGTGSAGATVAKTVHEAGKKVAIIDKLPFGGTCSQRGCDPKKVLVGAAEIIARSEQLMGKGIKNTPKLDWPALIRFKKTFTEPVSKKTEQQFSDLGLHCFHGAASFLSPTTLRVGDDELQAKQVVVATGQRPKPLQVPGEELLIDSTGFMEITQLPKKIVMVGGGYIAFEFAHVAARAGANVTILHQGKRPLEGFDADLVGLLVKAMEAIGIHIVLNAQVMAVAGKPGTLTVHYDKTGKGHTLSTNLVVHAAGRVADVAELALEKAGVDIGEKGIAVNEYLQSVSNPAVYACGDVADKGQPLTPLASYEGKLVADTILNGNRAKFVATPVPSVVFTVPPLASIGLTEEEAKKQNISVEVTFRETADWYSSRRINEPFSGFKLLTDKKTNQLVGAHLLGSGSEETINLITLAMNYRIPARELMNTLFAYPTHGSDLKSMV